MSVEAAALPPLPFIPEDDPVFPLPGATEMEAALRDNPREFAQFLTERQEKVRLRKEDPFRHGFEPAIWHVADDLLCKGCKVVLIDPVDGTPREILGGSEVYLSGGNRASKTDYAAKRLVQKLYAKPWQRTWCFHTTGPSSIAMQQLARPVRTAPDFSTDRRLGGCGTTCRASGRASGGIRTRISSTRRRTGLRG